MTTRCGDCAGTGQRMVSAKYAEHTALGQVDPELGADDPHYPSRLAAARNTTYPCKTCNPDAFYRWASGEWGQGSSPRRGKRRGGDPGPIEPPDPPPPDYASRAAGDF